MKELRRLLHKTTMILKADGPIEVMREVAHYIPFIVRKITGVKRVGVQTIPKDVLFISGTNNDAPMRYRCTFQQEQLEQHGISTDVVFYGKVTREIVQYYDVIILYRVPLTDEIKQIIQSAKVQNKLVIYDIDDLVFDAVRVAKRKEVKEMNHLQREKYFDGVTRYFRTMQLCDYATTSTETIAQEMQKVIPTVHVNRNSVGKTLHLLSDRAYHKASKKHQKRRRIFIGYLSGSKTHDDDLEMIAQPLATIMEKHKNVFLVLVGPVTIPSVLSTYKKRIVRKGFQSWKKLPETIAMLDINLAPLVSSTFNDAKSEIKYTEAALVRCPTIASSTVAFRHAIRNGKNGFLAETSQQWINALTKLIVSKDLRESIGVQAYTDVVATYNTHTIGAGLVSFIQKHRAKKVVYIAPSINISGGVIVIATHLRALQKRGWNALFVTQVEAKEYHIDWLDDFTVPIMPSFQFYRWKSGLLDRCVATMWSTVREVLHTPAKKKYYFVQNKEYDFYTKNNPYYKKAHETYTDATLTFFTMSRWCQRWLKEEFCKDASYVPNGIDTTMFCANGALVEQKESGKIRILIEGNPDDDYKNVDESFRIIDLLDHNLYEVWFISYGGKPKKWYHYDRFFEKVPYKDMPRYYRSCDILLKTSRLESFSYPPLEMMACGGAVVVAHNDGNAEYVQHGVNALVYKRGDIKSAMDMIKRVSTNDHLKNILIKNGNKTAHEWTWDRSIAILEDILK